MLFFWSALAALTGIFLALAFKKNGRKGLCQGMLLVVFAAILIGVDQAVKLWARTILQPLGSMPFIPHVLQLRYVLNTGAAFSILEGQQLLLALFTGLVLAGLGGYLILNPPKKRLEYAAWVLILAGGVGNLIDRVARGAVVDLFDTLFMEFAVFNVADICITVGFGLLLLFYLLQELGGRAKNAPQGAGDDEASALQPGRDVSADPLNEIGPMPSHDAGCAVDGPLPAAPSGREAQQAETPQNDETA